MLAAALHAPPLDPDAGPARARLLADRAMAKVETSLTKVELTGVRLLVARTQHFTRLRERMRLWGIVKCLAWDRPGEAELFSQVGS